MEVRVTFLLLFFSRTPPAKNSQCAKMPHFGVMYPELYHHHPDPVGTKQMKKALGHARKLNTQEAPSKVCPFMEEMGTKSNSH